VKERNVYTDQIKSNTVLGSYNEKVNSELRQKQIIFKIDTNLLKMELKGCCFRLGQCFLGRKVRTTTFNRNKKPNSTGKITVLLPSATTLLSWNTTSNSGMISNSN